MVQTQTRLLLRSTDEHFAGTTTTNIRTGICTRKHYTSYHVFPNNVVLSMNTMVFRPRVNFILSPNQQVLTCSLSML